MSSCVVQEKPAFTRSPFAVFKVFFLAYVEKQVPLS